MRKSCNHIKAFGYWLNHEIEICDSIEQICKELTKMLNIFLHSYTFESYPHFALCIPIYLHLH